jgi:hypothetical protein
VLSLIWHKNLTLNPSPIGEGVGDEVKLSQFTTLHCIKKKHEQKVKKKAVQCTAFL